MVTLFKLVVVRRIFTEASLGKGLRSIANTLNKQGYKTKHGNDFSTTAVKGILENPLYEGKVRYGQYRHWEKKRRKGKQNNYVLADGKQPAIISSEQWSAVSKLMAKRHKIPAWNLQGSNVLTGLLKCPEWWWTDGGI